MTVIRLLARPLLASTFVVGGVNALKNAPQLATRASTVSDRVVPFLKRTAPGLPVPEDPVTQVRLNAAVQLGAAAALATGRLPRLSGSVLAVSLVPTTVAGHPFWREQDPDQKKAQRLQFFKNASVLGGLLLASVDTEGRPGMAWRARHAARAARREARHLGHSARREAKLAAAKVK